MFCSPDMQISEGYYFAFFKFWTQSDKALPLRTAWYHFEGVRAGLRSQTLEDYVIVFLKFWLWEK